MDNFRKTNSSRPFGRGAVDGFGTTRPRSGQVTRRGALGSSGTTGQPRQSRIDNFRKTEGFRPVSQSKMTGAAAPRAAHPPRIGKQAGATADDARMKLRLPSSSAERNRKSQKRKKVKRTVMAIVLVLVLTGGIFFGNLFVNARKMFAGGGNAPALEANVDPTKLKGEGDGRVNILMLGKGGAGHEGADLTDTLLIASIDPIQKEAALLSIPRDFWVKTDGGQSKINAVYANAKYKALNTSRGSDANERAEQAGLAAIESTVEEITGIPMHYNVMVDFTAFEKAINTVGGIDINVTKDISVYERLWDPTTGKQYILDVKEGKQHFDGKRALFYARSRHTSARGDFDRAERQRAVLVALKDKIMSAGTYGNPVKVNQLVSEFGSHVRTSFSTGEVMRVYDIMKGVDSSKIVSVGLADQPHVLVETGMINGQSVVKPIAGLYDYAAIQSFIRNTLKDGYIKNENASVAVFNGSTITGLAGKKADELKSYGYNITTVGNAPDKNTPKTILVDLTGGKKKYTQNYLEQRLNVKAITSLPDASINPNGAEFVIILGQNESAN